MRCPRKRSDMTPCVITDGVVCYTLDGRRNPICVGCERPPGITGVSVDVEELRAQHDAYVEKRARDILARARRGRK